jgi:lysozyme
VKNWTALRLALRVLAAAFVFAIGPSGAQNAPPPAYIGTCPNGAPVKYEQYCRLVVHYRTDAATPLDPRIAEGIGFTEDDGSPIDQAGKTRSIGLIIAIDKYPNMPGNDLSAAAVDAENLQKFLIGPQKFDEIILLRNADATAETINYFLKDYLVQHAADYGGKARLVIAYSGHGRSETQTLSSAFILGNAPSVDGTVGIYEMKALADAVRKLSSNYFHVLTLINACYGGSFFGTSAGGGNANAFTDRGSYGMTAGPSDDEVLSLVPSRGSLFFDVLINGVTRGVADPLYWQTVRVDGEGNTLAAASASPGLTRTASLSDYLISVFQGINHVRYKSNHTARKISNPWLGPIQEGVAAGGFFFLSDSPNKNQYAGVGIYLNPPLPSDGNIEVAMAKTVPDWQKFGIKLGALKPKKPSLVYKKKKGVFEVGNGQSSPVNVPLGPISSIVGRPDIKVFKAPEIYPVKGYDFSAAEGSIDWKAFSLANPRPTFIYARALGWRGPDKTFADRWGHAKSLGFDYGAYLKFDFCRTPDSQLKSLSAIVPVDPSALPLGIELVTPTKADPKQLVCYKKLGVAGAQGKILEFAAVARERFGKTPLFYGNRYNLSVLIDDRSNGYMIWLGAYSAGKGRSALELSGSNPWTLWQYSGSLKVPGVGEQSTGEVFFGTRAQYAEFKQGKVNVARAAVTTSN